MAMTKPKSSQIEHRGESVQKVLDELVQTQEEFAKAEVYTQHYFTELKPNPGNNLSLNATQQAIGVYEDRIFMTQNVASTNGIWAPDSVVRISEYQLARRGRDDWDLIDNSGADAPIAVVDLVGLGHGGGLSITRENGQTFIYTTVSSIGVPVTGASADYGTGYSKVHWKGSNTTQADVTHFRGLKDVQSAEVCVSSDGKYLIFAGYKYYDAVRASGEVASTESPWVTVFDRAELEAAVDKTVVNPLYSFKPPVCNPGNTGWAVNAGLAGVVSEGNYIYLLYSGAQVVGSRGIAMLTMSGEFVKSFTFDGMAALDREGFRVGRGGKLCFAYEIEGLAFYKGALLACTKFNMSVPDKIVSCDGKNFFATATNTDSSPIRGTNWQRTEAPATEEWNKETTYPGHTDFTYHKYVTAISPAGVLDRPHGLSGALYPDNPSGLIQPGNDAGGVSTSSHFFASRYERQTQKTYPLFEYRSSGVGRLYHTDYLIDNPTTYDKTDYSGRLTYSYSTGTTISGGSGVGTSATIFLGNSRDASDRPVVMYSRGVRAFMCREFNYTYVNIVPTTNGTLDIGSAAQRFNNLYLATAPNVSSDERVKSGFRGLSSAEISAALEIKREIGLFQLNDAVEKKGVEGARFHAGVIAQQVVGIMQNHGLDWTRYAFICYDEWDEQKETRREWGDEFDDDGNLVRPAGSEVSLPYRAAGSMYSIRYEQLGMFILAAM